MGERNTRVHGFLRLVVIWGRAREEEEGDPGCELGGSRGELTHRRCLDLPAPPLPVPSSPQAGAAQQSPSVAMATSISLLPISSKALARLLRSPSSCCRASQRSRITPVGLALVAK